MPAAMAQEPVGATDTDAGSQEDGAAGAAERPAKGGGSFRALLLRDFVVLDKNLLEFVPNTIVQPLLLVFTFTYVFPRIGMTSGGTAATARFSTLLMGGMVAQAVVFNGIFRVAVPLARELDVTHELEDRVLAPMPLSQIAIQKIVSGALQALFAAIVVFPVAAFVPATPIYLFVNWPVLVTVLPLACLTSAALGLTVGTRFDPRSVPVLTGFVALPLAFLGAIFYTWDSLTPIPWMKYLVLVNPLVYVSEGLRAALTIGIHHMPLPVIYSVLSGSAAVLTMVGVRGFRRRILS